MRGEPRIDDIAVDVYRVPTDAPEADGSFEWNSTTMVLVRVSAAGETGLGYSYTSRAAAAIVHDVLAPRVAGANAFDVIGCWTAMLEGIRNLGRPGVCATAIAAVDSALWDLKARVLGISLLDLLGAQRDEVPVYGSGGFTSYADERLMQQLRSWVDAGVEQVKMKIGADIEVDAHRVFEVRRCIGRAKLFVDANGAFEAKQATEFAERVREAEIVWFEEPVSSDDLAGLRFVREHAPAGMRISAGEYGYDEFYFRRMLESQAVDVLQADATRCCGITGFMRADALAASFHRPLSSHCAPAVHAHPCCAATTLQHLEYFHDHARIEHMLFDGTSQLLNGRLRPDRTCPGNGLHLREADAERYRI